jgi:hypothetical protein
MEKLEYRDLYKGVKNPDIVMNINNKKENLLKFMEKMVKQKNARKNIIEFGGSNYPWSSDKKIAEDYGRGSNGIVFLMRTNKGMRGGVLAIFKKKGNPLSPWG